ncbi:MAG: ferredoxin [Bacteroidales bacterium]|nr:ferredoxin [Bacteroidales bacterium]
MIKESDYREQTIIEIAKKMALAARTAPKGRGRNTIETLIATKSDIEEIAARMDKIAIEKKQGFFTRDANNIRNCDAVLFLGTTIDTLKLPYCGFCGLENCETKDLHQDVPCTFNSVDLGIAIGSAVSIAADNRIDNRVLFSAGKAVQELKLFDENIKIIFGIGLSASRKNIFFDRK